MLLIKQNPTYSVNTTKCKLLSSYIYTTHTGPRQDACKTNSDHGFVVFFCRNHSSTICLVSQNQTVTVLWMLTQLAALYSCLDCQMYMLYGWAGLYEKLKIICSTQLTFQWYLKSRRKWSISMRCRPSLPRFQWVSDMMWNEFITKIIHPMLMILATRGTIWREI